MMRGQALRYLGWQWVDRLMPRLVASWFIYFAILWLISLGMRESNPPDQQLLNMVAQLHQQFGAIILIIITHGIVSADRTAGFFRFYLAKPVSPVWFYGQAGIMALVTMLLASAGAIAMASWLIRPLWQWDLLANSLALFLLFGFLVFMFSTLSNRMDWALALGVLLISAVLRDRFPVEKGMIGKVLNVVLMPNHLIGWRQDMHAAQWAWVAGWGIGLFVIGLVILRTRALGED